VNSAELSDVLQVAIPVVGGLGGVLFTLAVFQRSRQEKQAETEVKQGMENAVDKLREHMNLPNLIEFNRNQIDLYHLQTRKQARSSFRWSQFAMATGLLILAGGAIVAIRAPDDTTKVVAGVLAGVGGAFSGYITQTFMSAHRVALEQLNKYFQQPVLASYLLAAERLLEKMTPAEHDRVYGEIVDVLLASAHRPDSKQLPARRRRRRDSGIASETPDADRQG
jgi:hypothetical protein